MQGYKQGDIGTEDESKLTRMKKESWDKLSVSHGAQTTVDGGNLSGMKKSQVDSNFNALADKKDY
jgi:hypothetical protein|tara:strand:- start:1540 stop:1734 length:195 start_codon:yes stop_codon:yes gene_type:complete